MFLIYENENKGKTHMAYMFILLSIIREIVSARAEKYMKIFQIKTK